MALPKLNIQLMNGGLGRVAQTSDGVAGLIVSGFDTHAANKTYHIDSASWLAKNSVTLEKEPLLFTEVTEFYERAGEGAELYLMTINNKALDKDILDFVEQAPTLLDFAQGRIRLLGLNPGFCDYELQNGEQSQGLAPVIIRAIEKLQVLADNYAAKVAPFRAFVGAEDLNPHNPNLFKPREASYDRVAVVAAASSISGWEIAGNNRWPAAIGKVLGTAAGIPVHQSIARVRNGAVSLTGYLTNGSTVESSSAYLDALHDAGYIIYRTYPAKNGYYFNDDPTAAPLSDDYSNLNLGRVIDKAIVLAYNAYIDQMLDSIEVDESGYIPASMCVYYQNMLDRAILTTMSEEISSFQTYIDPKQNVLSSSVLTVNCMIVPKGILRTINVNLGFTNPAIKE